MENEYNYVEVADGNLAFINLTNFTQLTLTREIVKEIRTEIVCYLVKRQCPRLEIRFNDGIKSEKLSPSTAQALFGDDLLRKFIVIRLYEIHHNDLEKINYFESEVSKYVEKNTDEDDEEIDIEREGTDNKRYLNED